MGKLDANKSPTITEEGEETKNCSVCLRTEKQPIAQLIACTCNPKTHLGIGETCDCEGSDCNCTLQEYGELYPDSEIKIYRVGALTAEFTDTLITTAANNARTGYADSIDDLQKAEFTGKATEIHIFPVTEGAPTFFYRKEGNKFIVGFRSNRSSGQMGGLLSNIAGNITQPTIVNTQ